MSRHLQRDLDQIKKNLLQLGSLVETAIKNALIAFNECRPELAQNVIAEEKQIDEREVLIEEACLKTLALHQPMAMDLRFMVVVLKVNNDLERMGDIAVSIAERSLYLSSQDPLPSLLNLLSDMPDRIQEMVKKSLNALVSLDVELARKIIAMDDEVDSINRQMYEAFHAQVQQDPGISKTALGILSISRYLERIADLATNIAEDVIFMEEGEVVRHQNSKSGQ